MDISERHLGPCAHRDFESGEVTVVTQVLLQDLLLFESCVVQTHDLLEIPRMLELFDYRGLMSLLTSGALRFQPDRIFALNVDSNTTKLKPGESTASLRLDETTSTRRPGAYRVTVARIGNPAEEVDGMLRVVDELAGLSKNRRNRLRDALAGSMATVPDPIWNEATPQTHIDIDRAGQDLLHFVSRCLVDSSGRNPDPHELEVSVHREGEVDLFLESNLVSSFGLDEQVVHQVLGNALLAVARLNLRLALMKAHQAVSGLAPDEAHFLDRKMEFLVANSSPRRICEDFHRVLEIKGLPSIAEGIEKGALDVDRLLAVRQSEELREFRRWLRDQDHESLAEALERLRSVRTALGDLVSTGPARAVRFTAVTGIGLLGLLPGIASGALDSFVLDRILKRSGPATFLSRSYPSIFEAGRL